MDGKGRRREARDALAMRELQQTLPGLDRDAVHVRRPNQHRMVRKATSVRYDELPDVLTPKEAQAFLRLGRNATYAALQDGRIRSVRHGQKFLIPKAALREFLDRDAEHPRAGIPVKGTT
ncbi:MAG: helix-turn-helix domain-containing protein [Candidatus Cybelea sp.]